MAEHTGSTITGANETGRLHARAGTATLAEVAALWGTKPGTALVSTPTEHRVVAAEEITAFTQAFEVRIFDADREIRWLRDERLRDEDERRDGEQAAIGRCCVLSADASYLDLPSEQMHDVSIAFMATNQVQYLCWGTGTGERAVAEARVGTITLPITVAKGRRARIRAVEYITTDPYGNASVSEERLIALEEVSS